MSITSSLTIDESLNQNFWPSRNGGFLSRLLAISACIQITRRVVTALDGRVKTENVFPDLCLELLDACHFLSVDLVKVLTDSFFFWLIHYT